MLYSARRDLHAPGDIQHEHQWRALNTTGDSQKAPCTHDGPWAPHTPSDPTPSHTGRATGHEWPNTLVVTRTPSEVIQDKFTITSITCHTQRGQCYDLWDGLSSDALKQIPERLSKTSTGYYLKETPDPAQPTANTNLWNSKVFIIWQVSWWDGL